MTKESSFKKKTNNTKTAKENHAPQRLLQTNITMEQIPTLICKILVTAKHGIFRNKFTAPIDSVEI